MKKLQKKGSKNKYGSCEKILQKPQISQNEILCVTILPCEILNLFSRAPQEIVFGVITDN